MLNSRRGLRSLRGSHLLLMLRNAAAADLTVSLVGTVVCGMVFLSTRHQWNQGQLDNAAQQSTHDVWRVPESEVFEAVHTLRRKLVLWLRETAPQRSLDDLLDAVVRVSESDGSLVARAGEPGRRWAKINGAGSRGRFQQLGQRGVDDLMEGGVAEVEERDDVMQVDVQVMQLTLTGAHPQALQTSVAESLDVIQIFGKRAMQVCLSAWPLACAYLLALRTSLFLCVMTALSL